MCTPRSKENIDFNLTKKEVVITSKRCIQNVNSLLSCAKLLGDNDDTRQYAAGLYLYAVEEYGKAQLLKQLLKQTGVKYLVGYSVEETPEYQMPIMPKLMKASKTYQMNVKYYL